MVAVPVLLCIGQSGNHLCFAVAERPLVDAGGGDDDHHVLGPRVARNAELLDRLASARLDLALAWDAGGASAPPHGERVAEVTMRWIARTDRWHRPAGEPLPLVAFE